MIQFNETVRENISEEKIKCFFEVTETINNLIAKKAIFFCRNRDSNLCSLVHQYASLPIALFRLVKKIASPKLPIENSPTNKKR